MSDTPPSSSEQRSRAFDNLVTGADDTVGLLAYALFKQAIREDAKKGAHIRGSARDPSATTVQVYRASAEMRLRELATNAIQEAKDDIVDENTIAAIGQAKAEIAQKIDSNTNLRTTIVANLIAWAITLAVTVLVVSAVYLPNWTADMAAQMKRINDQPPPKPAN